MLLLSSNDPFGNACSEPKNECNFLWGDKSEKHFIEVPEVSLSLILRNKGVGCLKEKQQLCILTPDLELLGGLRSQLSVGFSQGHVAFEHMLSEGQKVLTSSSFFLTPGLSRMLQGDSELRNKKFIIGRFSSSFCLVGRWNFKEQPRISFQHLIIKCSPHKENPWNSVECTS